MADPEGPKEQEVLTKDDIPEIVRAVVAALPPTRSEPGKPQRVRNWRAQVILRGEWGCK